MPPVPAPPVFDIYSIQSVVLAWLIYMVVANVGHTPPSHSTRFRTNASIRITVFTPIVSLTSNLPPFLSLSGALT